MLIRWMPHFTDQRWSMVKAMRLCLLLSFALLTSVSHAADNSHRQIRQLAQLAEYIGADYVAAVDHNTVVNLDEYQESAICMHLFCPRCLTRYIQSVSIKI